MTGPRTHTPRERQALDAADAVAAGRPPPLVRLAPAATRQALRPPPDTAGRIRNGGMSLPADLRVDMEHQFQRDFSTVRITTDRDADLAARGFGARAFARGELLSFASGQYAPHSTLGRALIAHELTHVLQQRAAGRAEIACDGTGLSERAMRLRIAILQAPDAEARKPLVAQAKTMADTLSAALAAAKQADPPDGGDDADEPRTLIQLLGGALADRQEEAAAIEIAQASGDAQVKTSIVDALPNVKTVAGQQARLSHVAPLGGQTIAKSGDSRQWLKDNAGKIGRTLSSLDAQGVKGRRRRSASLEMTESLLGGTLVKSEEDERPHPTGDPTSASVRIDKTTKQIKADCDVYATIGARLLREQGWATVGYMVIVPHEQDPSDPDETRAAHAVALTRKPVDKADPDRGSLYVGISNAELRELGGEGQAITDEAVAMEHLASLMFDVYATPKPKVYDIYYATAGRNGAYDMRLLDPANKGLTPWRSAGRKPPAPKAGGTP